MMPLLNSSFEPGKAKEIVDAMEEGERKDVARAEYYYFRGNADRADKIAVDYIDSTNSSVKLSALLIFTFSNLSLGHIHKAKHGMEQLKKILKQGAAKEARQEDQIMSLFFWTTARVLLHLPKEGAPPLIEYVKYLPEGMQVFACYVIAHQTYLDGDYSRALGIGETCLAMQKKKYPIAEIYMRIIIAVSLMSLKRTEEAKTEFMKAWDMARKDHLYEGFSEHHGLLQGLIETCLKKQYPVEYKEIVENTYQFSAGWRKMHNPITNASVTDELTTTEFSIAMLANRRWTNVEIAEYMHLSEHTVKRYMSDIYQKLGITSRKQLHQFLLQ